MKRSSIIEARRKQVNPSVRQDIDLSFQIVDRIHEILQAKGLKQKDLALLLGKKEAEISSSAPFLSIHPLFCDCVDRRFVVVDGRRDA